MDKIKKFGYQIVKYFFIIITISLLLLLLLIMWGTAYEDKKDIGDGYVYYGETFDIHGPIVDIPSKIEFYAYDDCYILASQNYRSGSPYDMYDTGEYKDVWPGSIDIDKDYIVYWIVNKKTNQNILCGTEDEFIEKCKSIGVSDTLISNILP